MGEAKRRTTPIGTCIYCGAMENLSDEHVLPYGLGGDIVLYKASCATCAEKTSKVERRLLRGHWWPSRRLLKLPSRREGDNIPDLPVKIRRSDESIVNGLLPMQEQSVGLIFEFDPPSIFEGKVRTETPFAPRVYLKPLSAFPNSAVVDGVRYQLAADEKIEIPVNYSAIDLCIFLAKVAHGYAISRRGVEACKEFFLPAIICGNGDGGLTYVGGTKSPFLGNRLPGSRVHALFDRVNQQFLTVCIQLFRDKGDPPPIYEVVVGSV